MGLATRRPIGNPRGSGRLARSIAVRAVCCVSKYETERSWWIESDSGEESSEIPQMRACLRGWALRYWVDCPERLNEPLRRVGPRGSGLFEPVSWG